MMAPIAPAATASPVLVTEPHRPPAQSISAIFRFTPARWGQPIIDLAPYAKKNDHVRLRWDIGNDGCGGNTGWYVDDVQLYQCQ